MKNIGPYKIVRKLGEGNYGQVYEGRHSGSGEQVAIKCIEKRRIEPNLMEAMHLEIDIQKNLKHKHIAELFDMIETPRSFNLILEHCPGGDLENYLKHKTISEPVAQKWISQLISALVFLKSNNIMHRDLKLANVLVSDRSPSATVKLADFGFARFVASSAETMTILGTPVFMAPEILNRQKYSHKADVWSFGVFVFEMMTGKKLYNPRSLDGLLWAQKQPLKFPQGLVSPEAIQFITDVLVYDQDQRPSFEDLENHPFIKYPYISNAPRSFKRAMRPNSCPKKINLEERKAKIDQKKHKHHLQIKDGKRREQSEDRDCSLNLARQSQNLLKQYGDVLEVYKIHEKCLELHKFAGLAVLYACYSQLKNLFEAIDNNIQTGIENRKIRFLYDNIQELMYQCIFKFDLNLDMNQTSLNQELDPSIIQLLREFLVEIVKELIRSKYIKTMKFLTKLISIVHVLDLSKQEIDSIINRFQMNN